MTLIEGTELRNPQDIKQIFGNNVDFVSGAEMLAYLMDLQGLIQSDLAKELGGQPIVSKILKGERELNLRQVKALAKRFNVSPQVFIE